MLIQNPSQIYKAQLRGVEENETYRCLATFNFGDYFDETRKPFGNLVILNDETLAPKQTKSFQTEENIQTILIPLVGMIDYKDNSGNQNYIETAEIQLIRSSEQTTFEIQNPYENDLINYLQIRLKSNQNKSAVFFKKSFDLATRNELFHLLENDDYKISIGIFDGRSEAVYTLKNNNGALAFVIAGAFEFQNRLLESRDALSISEISEIEFEALSDDAILLVIETTLQD